MFMLGGIETNLEDKTKQKSGIRAEKKNLQVDIVEVVQSDSYYRVRFMQQYIQICIYIQIYLFIYLDILLFTFKFIVIYIYLFGFRFVYLDLFIQYYHNIYIIA